ncbi:MAG TPA: type II toxin-antitoxin system VapB family antitoxin [Micropepsaceae bacterium]|nr:type II toxin-antitoxin system VapB family antitoxin [Micropepsaceae bacterium]
MGLEIRTPEAGELARELANATGEDVDTAVLRAIKERLTRIAGRHPPGQEHEIDVLFERLARLPVHDPRPPDDIIAYGSDGLPH